MSTEQNAPPSSVMRLLRLLSDTSLGLTVAVAAAAVFTQVTHRFVLNDSVAWLDEFSGLIFSWMTMVGAIVVQRTDSHMSVDVFVRLAPRSVQSVLYLLRFLIVGAVVVVLFWRGLELTMRMSFVEYPAMEISRGFLYAILPVSMPFIALYLVINGCRAWHVWRQGEPVFGDFAHIDEHQPAGEQL